MPSGAVAFLFTDIEGSTRRWEREPDKMRASLGLHDEVLRRAIESRRGHVVKGTGDGMFAVFGSAVDAVDAAVDAQLALGEVDWPDGILVRVRMGLHVGSATVRDGDYFSPDVNRAARLMSAAHGGQIVCSSTVSDQVTERFTLVDLGEHQLRDLESPLHVFQVTAPGLSSVFPPLRSLEGHSVNPHVTTFVGRIRRPPWLVATDDPAPLVGRDDDVAALLQSWGRAVGGARVVVLDGEAGAGKTRLLGEFAGLVNEAGGSVLAGRCNERVGAPYLPFVEALRQYARGVAPREREAALGPFAADLALLLPELSAERFGSASDGDAEPQRLYDAVAGAVTAAARNGTGPLVVVIDDLHWASDATCAMLEHVVQRTADEPVLFVLALRRDELARSLPVSALLASVSRGYVLDALSLAGLERADVDLLLEAACAERDLLERRQLAGALLARTDGNAFFLTELIRVVAGSDEPSALEQVPETVQAVIGVRVAELPAEVADTLVVASVIGPEFSPVVLAGARGLDRRTALQHLAIAEEHALVTASSGQYRFVHALIRNAIYADLPEIRRSLLHADVAEAVEAEAGARVAEHYEEIADHLRLAGAACDPAKAVEVALLAGRHALAQHAAAEAEGWLTIALDSKELLDLAPAEEVDLLLDVAESRARRSTPDARTSVLSAITAAEQLDDGPRMARGLSLLERGVPVAQGDPLEIRLIERCLELLDDGSPARIRLLAQLSGRLFWARAGERRLALMEEALAESARLGDPAIRAFVLFVRDGTIHNEDYSPDELLEASAACGDDRYAFVAHIMQDDYCLYRNEREAASAALSRAAAMADELNDVRMAYGVSIARARHAMADGDLELAERHADATLEIGQRVGGEDAALVYAMQIIAIRYLQQRLGELGHLIHLPVFEEAAIPEAEAIRGLVASESGELELAREIFERLTIDGCTGLVEVGYNPVMRLCIASELCCNLGDVESAPRLYELLLPHRSRNASTTMAWAAPASMLLSRLALLLGDADAARDLLDEAEGALPAGHCLLDRIAGSRAGRAGSP
jgi:class 3 adenylate cyclase